jgi:hypothetical protein
VNVCLLCAIEFKFGLFGLLTLGPLLPDPKGVCGAKPIGTLTVSLENKKMGIGEIWTSIFPLAGASVFLDPSN